MPNLDADDVLLFCLHRKLIFLVDSQAATDGSTKDRLEFTKLALNTFYSNPFLGVGSNNFSILYMDKFEPSSLRF